MKSVLVLGLFGLFFAETLFAETVTVRPDQNLQAAVSKLQAGDTLVLEDGIYHQSLKLTRKTGGAPITIKAKTPGRAILTGAMALPPVFTKHQGAVYNAPWKLKSLRATGSTGQAFVMADERCLFNYRSLLETFNLDGVPLEGFFVGSDGLYIRLLGDADPNKVKMQVSRPDVTNLVELQGEDIVLEGLHLQIAPNIGILIKATSKRITISDCAFTGCYTGVENMAKGAVDITIERCQFDKYPAYQWMRYGQMQKGGNLWRAMYNSTFGSAGIVPGSNNVARFRVRNCYIHDQWDGIQGVMALAKDPNLESEYSYNFFHNCCDDSIEFDSTEYAGVRVHHNVFLDGFCLLGLSPVQGGGVTIEDNLFYVSPEYGLPWGVVCKFSTFRGLVFKPWSGIVLRRNSMVATKCAFQWGTSPPKDGQAYFARDCLMTSNLIFCRDWDNHGGLASQKGMEFPVTKDNLCIGPHLDRARRIPTDVPSSRNATPFLRPETLRYEGLPSPLSVLAAEGEYGEEQEIPRANFAIDEAYAQAALTESGLSGDAYKDFARKIGAVPQGTKWTFARPGPAWAVGPLALFHPPLPPSFDPWWVGFADQPSAAKTVKFKPWRGKTWDEYQSLSENAATVTASSADRPAELVVDCFESTRWQATATETAGSAWLELDLGRARSFNFIELAQVSDSGNIAVQVQRGETWETIHTFALPTPPAKPGKPETFSSRVPQTEARRVRILVTTLPKLGCQIGEVWLRLEKPQTAQVVAESSVKPAAIFGSSMVLQRDIPAPLWGTAKPSDTVTVEFAGQKKTATCDATGAWKVVLDPLTASAGPRTLTFTPSSGGVPAKLDDVLVGDVWLGNWYSTTVGQHLEHDKNLDAVAATTAPLLRTRIILSGHETRWQRAEPAANVHSSAFLLPFALALQTGTKVPIGMVEISAFTPSASAWLSTQAFQNDAACQERVAKITAAYDETKALATYQVAMAAWESAKKQLQPGQKPPPAPRRPINPVTVTRKFEGKYKQLITPLQPMAIRGVIWDFGLNSCIDGIDLDVLAGATIRGWRKEWGQDIAFLYLPKPDGGGCAWDPKDPVTYMADKFSPLPATVPDTANALERETYLRIRDVTNTAMVTTSDLGAGPALQPANPYNKTGYGARAARVALGAFYGVKTEIYGPVYVSHAIEGNKIRIKFSHVGQGLAFQPADKPQGFAIAGADKQFHWATAVIDGDSLLVSSEKVATPIAVRYAWASKHPWANLFNKDGLPALEFRTDNWTTGEKP